MLALGLVEIAVKFFELSRGSKITLDLVLQRFNQARHADEHRHAFVVNRTYDLRRIERVQRHRRAAENLRQENSQKLAEHMAERQQIQKSQRMKEALIAP